MVFVLFLKEMNRATIVKKLLDVQTSLLCVSDMKSCYGELNVSFESATSVTQSGSQNSITVSLGNSSQSKEKNCSLIS